MSWNVVLIYLVLVLTSVKRKLRGGRRPFTCRSRDTHATCEQAMLCFVGEWHKELQCSAITLKRGVFLGKHHSQVLTDGSRRKLMKTFRQIFAAHCLLSLSLRQRLLFLSFLNKTSRVPVVSCLCSFLVISCAKKIGETSSTMQTSLRLRFFPFFLTDMLWKLLHESLCLVGTGLLPFCSVWFPSASTGANSSSAYGPKCFLPTWNQGTWGLWRNWQFPCSCSHSCSHQGKHQHGKYGDVTLVQ